MPTVYSTAFEVDADGWTGTSVSRTTSNPRSVPGALLLSGAFGQSRRASRTISGLTIGVEYTFSAWGRDNNVTAPSGRIGVTGIGVGTAVPLNNSATYLEMTFVFTATATSHEFYMESASNFQGLHNIYLDDVSVTSADAVNGTVDQVFPLLVQEAIGTNVVPTFTASVAETMPMMSQAATGTRTLPVYSGTVAQVMPKLAQAVTATRTVPVFSGTAAQTLPKLTQAVTATRTVPVFSATVAQNFPQITQAITATRAMPVSTGTVAQALPALTQSAAGSVPPPRAGTVDQPFPAMTQAVTAEAHRRTATVAQTFPVVQQLAQGTNVNPQYQAVITQNFPQITQVIEADAVGAAALTWSETFDAPPSPFVNGPTGYDTVEDGMLHHAPATASHRVRWMSAESFPRTQWFSARFLLGVTPTTIAGIALVNPLDSTDYVTFLIDTRNGAGTSSALQIRENVSTTAATGVTGSLNIVPGVWYRIRATFVLANRVRIELRNDDSDVLIGAFERTFSVLPPFPENVYAGVHNYNEGWIDDYRVGPFEGAITQTFPTMTQSISADATTRTGTAAQTMPKMSQSIAATRAVPVYSGTVAQTFPKMTQAVAGTRTVPIFSGTAAQTMPMFNQSASGTVTEPQYGGTVVQVFPTMEQSAEGTWAPPDSEGTADQVFPSLAQSITATRTVPIFAGTVAQAFPMFEQTIVADIDNPEWNAVVHQQFPAMWQSLGAKSARMRTDLTLSVRARRMELGGSGMSVPLRGSVRGLSSRWEAERYSLQVEARKPSLEGSH